VKKHIKALIVDDSTAVLEMMQEMLQAEGIVEIDQALDGAQAVSQFQEALLTGQGYALVLLDILMPVLDGQETLKRMREMENNAGIPAERRSVIIMVTALHSPDDMVEAIINGDCNDYLVKPFEQEQLQDMLAGYDFCRPAAVGPVAAKG
jgi:two-component system chemotaxis response regulator CheY